MEPLSIEDWISLAATDPQAWQSTLKRRIEHCIETTGERVLCDHAIPSPSQSGPLAGMPFVIKDLFDWRGRPTRGGSILPAHSATSDADILTRFEAMGANCCGKTQLNEFAYGLSGENPHYGNCPNPLDPRRLSGGSSSGSAWMVARGIVPLAIGTDTGGSIRVPAAWCGIFGIRWQPAQFLHGCHPLAAGFDTAGWFTATARDMAASIETWFGDPPAPVAWNGDCCIPGDSVDPAIHTPLSETMANLDLRQNDSLLPWPVLQQAAEAFNILQSREAYAHHHDRLEQYGNQYDPTVRARLLRGRDWTADEVAAARATQAELTAWGDEYFKENQILCLPACPQPAPSVDQATPELREKTLALTALASLTGKPALTIPVRIDGQCSVGIQCVFKESRPAVPLEILNRFTPSKASSPR